MRILLSSPAPAGSATGNEATASRWAAIFRRLGHRVLRDEGAETPAADLLVALHARKSAEAVARFRRAGPERPVVLALTGTDLYADLATSAAARRSLELADRLVVLHPGAVDAVPAPHREKTHVIVQSAVAPSSPPPKPAGVFRVAVLAHLRDVKDPLRAAWAARSLPSASRVEVVHAGRALEPSWERRAREEMASNRRYRWLGPLPPEEARALLASSHLMVLASLLEGGANVVGEAVVSGVPILASRIPANVGLLGEDYPGYFPPRDTEALAALLELAEADPARYGGLVEATARRRELFDPAREEAGWAALLAGLGLRTDAS